MHEDLLGAERDRGGVLARERERLVEAVRVQRLRAAADGRERLHRDAHDVVLRLLGGQGGAAGLGVEAEGLGLRGRRSEAVAHDLRPQRAGGAELRDLLEEVVVGVEEEGEPGAERVGREARGDCRLAVGDSVRERECELLRGGRARLADVVAGDRDRVPARDPLLAVGEQVGRQPHRRARREDVVPARHVLLEDVVLHGAAERRAGHALILGHELVQQEQQRRRGVDRHRRRHPVERDPVEQQLHVGDRVDRDPRAADLALGHRVVRVVAELGRQVEGDRQPRLPAREQVAVALVRLLGRGEAGVLADRPRPTAVHVRIRPAREREDAGRLRLDRGRVGGPVQRLHLDAGVEQPPVGGAGHDPILRPCRGRPRSVLRAPRRPGRSRRARSARPTRCASGSPAGPPAGLRLEGLDDRAMLAGQVLAAVASRPPRITCIIRFTDSSR